MKKGIIYRMRLYQRGVVIRGGQEVTKTSGGGDASPSYNPPRDGNISRDCNFSSLYLLHKLGNQITEVTVRHKHRLTSNETVKVLQYIYIQL